MMLALPSVKKLTTRVATATQPDRRQAAPLNGCGRGRGTPIQRPGLPGRRTGAGAGAIGNRGMRNTQIRTFCA
jgi:hypothetical protein